jgi:hypothetical protein
MNTIFLGYVLKPEKPSIGYTCSHLYLKIRICSNNERDSIANKKFQCYIIGFHLVVRKQISFFQRPMQRQRLDDFFAEN